MLHSPSPSASPAPPPAPDQILWDVVAEHLDEAAFLYTQWEQALVSPLYKLEEVRDRVELRMLAHLDGLVVGGGLVKERLLLPALREGGQGLVFTAATALLLQASAQADEAVLQALREAQPPQLAELQRALQLFPSPQRQATLRQLLWEGAPAVRAAAARVLGFQQVDLGPALSTLLASGDKEARRAALYCLRYRPCPDGAPAIRQALAAADGEIATAGLLAAAVTGLREALDAGRFMVRNQHPALPAAALLLGLLGNEADRELLLSGVARPEHATALIFALGLGGNVQTADACVQWLHTAALAKVAGEAFVVITGVDPDREKLLAPVVDDPKQDPDAPEFQAERTPEADLALLDADAVAGWWSTHRSQFSASERLFRGKPIERQDPRAWLAALEQANMRQRHPLALALASVSQGRQLVQTLALCRDQHLSSA